MKLFIEKYKKRILLLSIVIVSLLAMVVIWSYSNVEILPETGGDCDFKLGRQTYDKCVSKYSEESIDDWWSGWCDHSWNSNKKECNDTAGESYKIIRCTSAFSNTQDCKKTIRNDPYESGYISYDYIKKSEYLECIGLKQVMFTMELYCLESNENTFEYKYDDNGLPSFPYYCDSEIKTCDEQGYEKLCVLSGVGSLDLAGCEKTNQTSTCVREDFCDDADGDTCTTAQSGDKLYQYCEKIPQQNEICDDDIDNDGDGDNNCDDSDCDDHQSCKPPDADNDGVPDSDDNCPDTYNPDQEDTDNDGKGDVCDDIFNCSGDTDCQNSEFCNDDKVCEVKPEITNTPTPTPDPEITSTPTITPTPITVEGITCGPLDSYNIKGEPKGDSFIELRDFISFRQVYNKTCKDDDIDYGVCGGKNRRYDNGDHVVNLSDFIHFAKVYRKDGCVQDTGLASLPETGEAEENVDYIAIVFVEIILSLCTLVVAYRYTKK